MKTHISIEMYGSEETLLERHRKSGHNDPVPMLRLGVIAYAHGNEERGASRIESAKLATGYCPDTAQRVLGAGAFFLVRALHLEAARTLLATAHALPGTEEAILAIAEEELSIADGTYRIRQVCQRAQR